MGRHIRKRDGRTAPADPEGSTLGIEGKGECRKRKKRHFQTKRAIQIGTL
jgi:hypothetical protein